MQLQVLLVDVRSLVWPVHQLSHFCQSSCFPAPIPVGSCSASFTRDLETVKTLNALLTVGKDIDVPACVALFSVLHYTTLNGTYFILECRGVQPKTEAVPLLKPHPYTPKPVPSIGLGPICVPDKFPFIVWVEPVLPFMLVGM